ncbi:MAG: hypothetical protein GF347_00475 [Candidatus Moranbacteria bacterium]|nr:hypothetical protein [Candidatus Moranbacteria bacterium]
MVEGPRPLVSPPGKVYSTSPREALSSELGDVVLKGPDLGIVFAEASAFQFARELGIATPDFGVCEVPGEEGLFFCSKKLRGRYPVDHWVGNGLVSNPEVIPETIAFDVWVANWDRNIGNFVEDAEEARGEGEGEGTKIFAIDFEKAAVLRGEPDRFTINGWPGSKFWPLEDLGRLCRQYALPRGFLEKIKAIDPQHIAGVLEQIQLDLDLAAVPWMQTSIDLLTSRAQGIEKLATEAWDE